MQCSWDKHEACSYFQVDDLVFVEELVRKPVRLEQLALLREGHQLEAALHVVPVQELVQGQTLPQELLMDELLAEQLGVHLKADLWVKRNVVAALYPKCGERNWMLGFDLATPGARNMVGHRRPLIPRECQGSYPDLKYNTFFSLSTDMVVTIFSFVHRP